MPSNYPAGYDSFDNPSSGDKLNVVPHATQHTDVNNAVEAVQAAIGLSPEGEFTTVRERLDRLDTKTVPSLPYVKMAGHSYMVTSGIYEWNQTIPDKIKRIFGLSDDNFQNIAVAGGAAGSHNASASWATSMQEIRPEKTAKPYSADMSLGIVNFGANDMILGTGVYDRQGYRESMKVIISRFRAARVFDHNDASVVTGGVWTDEHIDTYAAHRGGGTGNYTTTAIGATLTITTPSDFEGGYVALIFPGSYAGGTADVSLDGVPDGTVTSGNMHSSIYSSKYAATLYRVNIPTGGAHTIVVTTTAMINSGPFMFNGWHIEADPAPPVAVYEQIRFNGSLSGVSDADIAVCNTDIDTVITWFDDDYVFLVEVDALMNDDDSNFISDRVHPNERGASIMVTALYEKLYSQIKRGKIDPTHLANSRTKKTAEGSVANWIGSWYDKTNWIEDDFIRVDDAADIGTSTSGHTYTIEGGVFGIDTNEAYPVSVSGTRAYATIDIGSSEVCVEATLENGANFDGIVMRFKDADNHIRFVIGASFATFGIYSIFQGTSTLIGNTGLSGSLGAMRIMCQGNKMYVYEDDSLIETIEDDLLLRHTGTEVGLLAIGTSARWSYFAARPIKNNRSDWATNWRYLNEQTGDYTFASTDASSLIIMNKATAQVLTVPATTTALVNLGSYIDVVRIGAGTVTLTADAGVTINNLTLGNAILATQYGYVRLYRRSGNIWDVVATPLASDTASGVVELATAAETTTGTDAARVVTPDGLAGSNFGKRVMNILVTDPNGDALTTGDGKMIVTIPQELDGMNLVGAHASVTTVSSSGLPAVMIHNLTDAQDMLSTAITIDVSEYSSYTATTPPVINGTYDDVATGDRIRIDVDTAGTGTKGLSVILTFQLP